MRTDEQTSICRHYQNEAALVAKINQLTERGYEERDLYVVARDKDDISLVKRKTDAKVEEASANWMQKFAGVTEGEQEVKRLTSVLLTTTSTALMAIF